LQNLSRQVLTFDGMMAVLLAIMLFYPPFFRGLFFENELLPTHIVTAAIFALFAFYKLERRELLFFERPLDYAVFILLGLYITSSIDAWSVRDAIEAVLKMANYAAIYWLLAYSVRSLSAVRGYLGVLLASGVGVSLLGLGAAIGTFPYKDAFVGGRIYASLQYPNSTAAFLMTINLFGLYLWDESRNRVLGVLMTVANFLIFLTILGTESRGVLLIYPVVLVIMMLGLSGRQRWNVLGRFGLQLVASVAVIGEVMAHTGGKTQLQGWLWVLGGAVFASLIYLVWQYIATSRQGAGNSSKRRLQPWVAPAAVALVVVVVAAAGFGLWHERGKLESIAAKADPQTLVARLKTISWGDINLQERLVMSRDAMKIMVSSPANALLGAGGGGWNATYHKVQPYPYFSTETHDDFMQTGVETGFPGLLDFLLIWGFFIAAAWRLYHHAHAGAPASADRPPGAAVSATAWVILCSALALGIASAMDFNLSLGAVALLLWGLFGLMRGLERLYGPEADARAAAIAEAAAAQDRRSKARHKKNEPIGWKMPSSLKGIIVGALSLLVFFGALDLILGIQYAEAGDTAAKANNVQQAISNYEQAIQHDYCNTDFRSMLSQYYLYMVQQDEQSLSKSPQDQTAQNDESTELGKAQDVMSEAVKLSRGDSSLRMLYAQVLFRSGSVDEGLSQLEEANSLLPLDKSTYEGLATGYFAAGRFYLEQANQQGASGQEATQLKQMGQNDLEQVLKVPGRIQKRMAGVSKNIMQLWTGRGFPLLEVTPTVNQNAGMADVLLGRYQEADGYLQASLSDSSLKATSQLWEGISLQKQGQASAGQQLISQATSSDRSLASELPQIEALLPK
jgi:tetratricopeptide (TPR) repeat protein